MKIRVGFVANSSSTSFCIIGTSKRDIVEQCRKLFDAGLNGEYFPQGVISSINEKLDGISFDGILDYVGIPIESAFSDQSKSLEDCKTEFKNILEENGIDVSLNNIRIIYGEVPD